MIAEATYRVSSHSGNGDDLVTFTVPSAELQFFRIAINVDILPLARLASAALSGIVEISVLLLFSK